MALIDVFSPNPIFFLDLEIWQTWDSYRSEAAVKPPEVTKASAISIDVSVK